MNSLKSPSNIGAGSTDVLSVQILLGPKYQELLDVSFGEVVLSLSHDKKKEEPDHQELLDVSFGELVLSSSHDKRKEEVAPSDLYCKSSVPSDDSVASTAPSDLSVESTVPSDFSDASLSKTSMLQIWVFDYLSRIHRHGMKVRDYSRAIPVLHDMLPASAAEKAKELTLKVRDYSSRMLHHAFLPALAADKVKKLTRKGLASSKPNSILIRILYFVVVVAALTFASSTRYYNEKTFQLSPESVGQEKKNMPVLQEMKKLRRKLFQTILESLSQDFH
jgi:hypothetical protein